MCAGWRRSSYRDSAATRSLSVGDSGAKGGEQLLGEDKALELLELRHGPPDLGRLRRPAAVFKAVNDSEDDASVSNVSRCWHISGDKAWASVVKNWSSTVRVTAWARRSRRWVVGTSILRCL